MVSLLFVKQGVYANTPVSQETVKEPPVVVETTLPRECLPYLLEVEKYDWNVDTASKIMLAESGCNPNAVNKKDDHGKCLGSYGLFQISCTTSTSTDPEDNIRMAYVEKYKKGGWDHWSVCKPTVKDGIVISPKVKCIN